MNAQEIRDFANLPAEVPNQLIETHIGLAERRTLAELGTAALPTNNDNINDVVQLYAYISLLPFLNTFSLNGASKVARLVQSEVDMRFLDAADVNTLINTLEARASKLLATAKSNTTSTDDTDTSSITTSNGSIHLRAI